MHRVSTFSIIVITAFLSYGCVVIDTHPLKISNPESLQEYEQIYYNNGSSVPLSSLFWTQSEDFSHNEISKIKIQFMPPGSLLVSAYKNLEESVLIKEKLFIEGDHFRFEDGFITRKEWGKGYKLGIEDSLHSSLLLIMGTDYELLSEGGPLPLFFIDKDITHIRYIPVLIEKFRSTP